MMLTILRRTTCYALFSFCMCGTAWAQTAPQELPPTDDWPRDRAAWRAKESGRQQRFKSQYPEDADAFDAMQRSHKQFSDAYLESDAVIDAAAAEIMLQKLYVDWDNPVLNTLYQYYITGVYRTLAREHARRLTPEARARLLAGMLAYQKAGGGRSWPMMQADLAATLSALGPDDPAVQQLAFELLADALQWAETIDRTEIKSYILNVGARHFGDGFWLQLHDRRMREKLPEKLPKPYEKAAAALWSLLTEKEHHSANFARDVREATELARVSLSESVLEDDLVSRLLIVYWRLLERSPAIEAKAAEYIQEQLLRLGGQQRRLRSAEHWTLWVEAVRKINARRLSPAMERLIRQLLEKPDPKLAEYQETIQQFQSVLDIKKSIAEMDKMRK